MAHGYLNYFVTYMTAAERAVFTPDPPEVASGMPAQGYLIYETDTGKFWTYDGSSLVAFDPSEAGALLAANNLDDVADPATAQENLGFVVLADQAAYDALSPPDNDTFYFIPVEA